MTTISKSISNTGMPGTVAGKERTSPLRSAELVPMPDGVAIESILTEGSGSAYGEGLAFTDGERTRRENCGWRDGSVDRMERTSRQEFSREELPPTSSNGIRLAPSRGLASPEDIGDGYFQPERGTVTQTSIFNKEVHTAGERFSTTGKCTHGWKAVNQTAQIDGCGSAASQQWEDNLGEEAIDLGTASGPGHHPRHSLGTSGSTNHTTEVARKRKRAYKSRTKTGCITCRRRKKKCDETQPLCT